MMLRRYLAPLLLVVAALLLLGYWRSDRNQILRQLDRVEELIAKTGPEDQLTAFGRVRKVTEMFAPGFLVLARPYESAISDPQELARVLAGYRAGLRTLRLVNRNRSVTIDKERGTARMRLQLEVWSSRGLEPSRESFDIRIGWLKESGTWWLREVELLSVDTDEWLGIVDEDDSRGNLLE
ncbi:MAG TPA: hypothetical protein PKO05_05870 [Thermoanaerobaculia bacterium]|jgi:hypothetical protein|nr:hypothetical protein [Thermoanaerobaculia bacterium]MDI9631285.1 hypothetical protein [Acidobacteriota bacterium]OQC40815.1 MAG: hypothetical protein BWX64_01296 [Acidobacteria bacterium ADurb.Bin051]MBP7812036.1 hypothetical protein [Thermoanaerobaculia bacterium]HNU82938.1 hypothetical protein [Thermoanaerobaculia bacterium]